MVGDVEPYFSLVCALLSYPLVREILPNLQAILDMVVIKMDRHGVIETTSSVAENQLDTILVGLLTVASTLLRLSASLSITVNVTGRYC